MHQAMSGLSSLHSIPVRVPHSGEDRGSVGYRIIPEHAYGVHPVWIPEDKNTYGYVG